MTCFLNLSTEKFLSSPRPGCLYSLLASVTSFFEEGDEGSFWLLLMYEESEF